MKNAVLLWLAAAAIAVLFAAVPVLFDGPDDVETAQMIADDLADAIVQAQQVARQRDEQ